MEPLTTSPFGVFPSWEEVIKFVFFASMAAYCVTEFCRNLLEKLGGAALVSKWYWDWLIRALSTGSAAVLGYWMAGSEWGVLLGVFSGIQNAALVKVFKNRLFVKLEQKIDQTD